MNIWNKQKIKNDYLHICTILGYPTKDVSICSINILLVIYGIRQAFWYDCWDLNKKKLFNLLHFLDTLKENGIKYKFDNGDNYIKDDDVVEEGPLIYNTKILKKKLVSIIEKNDLKIIYHYPIFGKILGYTCPLNIYDKKVRKKSITIRYFIKKNDDTFTSVYSFICQKYKLKKKINNIIHSGLMMQDFIQNLHSNYKIYLDISQ